MFRRYFCYCWATLTKHSIMSLELYTQSAFVIPQTSWSTRTNDIMHVLLLAFPKIYQRLIQYQVYFKSLRTDVCQDSIKVLYLRWWAKKITAGRATPINSIFKRSQQLIQSVIHVTEILIMWKIGCDLPAVSAFLPLGSSIKPTFLVGFFEKIYAPWWPEKPFRESWLDNTCLHSVTILLGNMYWQK